MATGKEATPERSPISPKALSQRLEQLRGERPYVYIAEMTGVSTESARRHVQFGNPHPEFLARVCLGTNCSPEWLLLGRGPALRDEAVAEVLENASLSQLGRAIGAALERLDRAIARVSLPGFTSGTVELKPTQGQPRPPEKGREGQPDVPPRKRDGT